MDLRQLDTSSPWPRSAAHQSRRGGLELFPAPAEPADPALEAALGTQLLYRTSRRVELTQAGEALLARARAIQQQIKLAEDEVRAIGAGWSALSISARQAPSCAGAWPICWRRTARMRLR